MRNAPGAESRVTSRANISYLSPFFVYAQNTSLVLPLSLSRARVDFHSVRVFASRPSVG